MRSFFLLALAITVLASAPGRAQSVGWLQTLRERGWVFAIQDSSAPHAVPSPADQLVLRSGAGDRVLYELRPTDIALSEPIVSRDGRWLAFAKSERGGTKPAEYLYVMDVADGTLRRTVALPPPALAVRGTVRRNTQAAWSHDAATLAYYGQARWTPDSRPWGVQPRELIMIDMRTLTVRSIAVPGLGARGAALTSQAWAPDNRQLAYTNDAGAIVMLDAATMSSTPLGSGTDATWSPDGRWIAARQSAVIGHDYVLIDAAPPHARRLLLDADWLGSAAKVLIRASRWFGPALWSPDARWIVLWRLRGEREEPYVIDRTRGSIEPLPSGHWIRSLGGAP
jgi:Tol biopolymer transport system component